MTIKEIMHKYTAGEFTLEQANAELEATNATFHLDPEKNTLSAEEIKLGFGLLDTGTGYMDKALMVGGQLVHADCGDMVAFFYQNGTTYRVHGNKLVAE